MNEQWRCVGGFDPGTDMVDAMVRGAVTGTEYVSWLHEWVEYGAQPQCVCRWEELGGALCDVAVRLSYGFAWLLGWLTI